MHTPWHTPQRSNEAHHIQLCGFYQDAIHHLLPAWDQIRLENRILDIQWKLWELQEQVTSFIQKHRKIKDFETYSTRLQLSPKIQEKGYQVLMQAEPEIKKRTDVLLNILPMWSQQYTLKIIKEEILSDAILASIPEEYEQTEKNRTQTINHWKKTQTIRNHVWWWKKIKKIFQRTKKNENAPSLTNLYLMEDAMENIRYESETKTFYTEQNEDALEGAETILIFWINIKLIYSLNIEQCEALFKRFSNIECLILPAILPWEKEKQDLFLQHFHQVSYLRFDTFEIFNTMDSEFLSRFFQHFSSIKVLKLEKSSFQLPTKEKQTIFLESFPFLKNLTINEFLLSNFCQDQEEAIKRIMQNLEYLEITEAHINDSILSVISHAKKLKSLKIELNFQRCSLDLLQQTFSSLVSLEYLSVENMNLHTLPQKELIWFTKSLSNITSLQFSISRIDQMSINNLILFLSSLKRLEGIDISGNHFHKWIEKDRLYHTLLETISDIPCIRAESVLGKIPDDILIRYFTKTQSKWIKVYEWEKVKMSKLMPHITDVLIT